MANAKQEFVLRHTFKKFSKLGKEQYSPIESHFGVPWCIGIGLSSERKITFYLHCKYNFKSRLPEIEVKAKYGLISTNGKFLRFEDRKGNDIDTFDEDGKSWGYDNFASIDEVVENCVKNDKLTAEIRVEIVKMAGFHTKKKKNFNEPNGKMTDVCLVVDGKKFYVSKMMLAEHSPVFEAMFFGEFVEAESKEVVIEDVAADSFEVFLSLIYWAAKKITAENVEELLQLADRYDVSCVLKECEDFLMETHQMDDRTIRDLSVKYSLVALETDLCTIYWRNTVENRKYFMENPLPLKEKANVEKEFVLRHTFKQFSRLKKEFSPIETHFGIPWRIEISRTSNEELSFYLSCKHIQCGWRIEVHAQYGLISTNGEFLRFKDKDDQMTLTFYQDQDGTTLGYNDIASIDEVVENCVENDELTAEIRVKIVKMTGITFKKKKNFDEPNGKLTDLCLLVDGKKFHASKMMLAEHSLVFQSMFFGEFVEAKSEEVVIEDTDADTFEVFLSLIYSTATVISEKNVEGLLQLADRYKVSRVTKECEEFLEMTNDVEVGKKLVLSEKYSLESLQSACLYDLSDLSRTGDVAELMEYVDQMGKKSLRALLENVVDLYVHRE